MLTLVLVAGLAAGLPGSALRGPRAAVSTRRSGLEPRSAPAHDLHLTHTRMVVEGTSIVCRIRLFKDDLEKALAQFSGRAEFRLGPEARADSLFGAYVGRTLVVDADGKRVPLLVTASGAERDPSSQDVVWYVLEGEAAAPPKKLGLLHGVMFELFRDQQNLVQLLREPGGVRKTLYFVSTDPREQLVGF